MYFKEKVALLLKGLWTRVHRKESGEIKKSERTMSSKEKLQLLIFHVMTLYQHQWM